jgi:hypothetical protein
LRGSGRQVGPQQAQQKFTAVDVIRLDQIDRLAARSPYGW